MKYTDYLSGQEQGPQEEPQAQQPQANALEGLAAQLETGKYYSLQAEARRIIAEEGNPSALAARLTAAIFGPASPEALTVSEAIEKAQRPGGYELAIDFARQRRGLFRRQLDKLAEQQRELAAQMGLAEAEERQLIEDKAAAGAANAAMLAVVNFAQDAAEATPETFILQARDLCEKHSGSRPAMGLLYGTLTEQLARAYDNGASLDLVQQQAARELLAKIAEAAGLKQ